MANQVETGKLIKIGETETPKENFSVRKFQIEQSETGANGNVWKKPKH